MALIKCSECGIEFSNKAKACPNCACPIEEIEIEEKDNVLEEIDKTFGQNTPKNNNSTKKEKINGSVDIAADEKIILVGKFNQKLQKNIIFAFIFPLYAIAIFFLISSFIMSFVEEEFTILFVFILAIFAIFLINKLKKWLYSFVDEEYLVLTNKRLLMKLKWQKISLVYSKITAVTTNNFIFRKIRLVVNLGSTIYIAHLINDEEIAEEILKRID